MAPDTTTATATTGSHAPYPIWLPAGYSVSTPSFPSGPGWPLGTALRNTALIAASPGLCLSVLLDADSYPDWCRFVARVWATNPASSVDNNNNNNNDNLSTAAPKGPSDDPASHDPAGWVPLPGAVASCPPPLREAVEAQGRDLRRFMLLGTVLAEEVHMYFSSADPATADKSSVSYNVITALEEFEVAAKDAEGRETGQKRKGLRLAWRIRDGNWWFLAGERVQELVETDTPGVTQYTSTEVFAGPAAWLIRWLVGGTLFSGMEDWALGLKREAESRARKLEA